MKNSGKALTARGPDYLPDVPRLCGSKGKDVTSMFDQFTLGIEEEFQIVDPHTRELRSHISEILTETGKSCTADSDANWKSIEN